MYQVLSAAGWRCAVVAAVSVTMLAGCGRHIKDSRVEELDSHSRQLIADDLARAADRAVKAQETLALVQRARTEPSPLPVDPAGLPAELRRPATMNWAGPGHEAARQVAGLVGYDFRIVGNPPAVAPMVNVAATDVPVGKIFEDIGLQVQGVAQIAVDPNSKRVEFRYFAMNSIRADRTIVRSRNSGPAFTK